MKLYTYWRSTSSYRLRIALNLKGLAYEHAPVHLVKNGGEQNTPEYRALNPQGRVPILVLDDGTILRQSPAIIEYLEETYPNPALLPVDKRVRACIRAVAAIVGCDIHPLHNVSALNYIKNNFGQDDEGVASWIQKWIYNGFDAIEPLLGKGDFSFGASPSLADVYIIPQIYAARRFSATLDKYPQILKIEKSASNHPAFVQAHPDCQPDKA